MSEALRLADLVEHDPLAYSDDAAAELRRLSAELAALKATIEAQGVPDLYDLRDSLVAISHAVAEQNDMLAQALIGDTLAMLASAPPAPQVDVIDYKPGTWFDATSVDLMHRFFESRLPAIREVAREHGYAIGVHGSMRRDMDLIAAPWREGASTADELAHAIANAACGINRDGLYQWENKPAGRVATSIPICWTHRHGVANDGHIDLSVMPKDSTSIQSSNEDFEAWILADSTLPLGRDAHGYTDMTTALMWHAWQAASKKASAVQHEPVAWKHDCASLLTNDVELWIDACPHCGKPRTHPAQQAKPQPDPLHDDIQSVLFEVEQAIQNGCCPWQVEAAFEAYEAARRLQQPAHGIQGS